MVYKYTTNKEILHTVYLRQVCDEVCIEQNQNRTVNLLQSSVI